jgi:nitrite reductase (NADH) large subunit
MTRIVVVGNGMVSHRLCDKLVEHRAAQRTADGAALERSEMGGGDPAGSAGGTGGKAPRGIDDIVVCGEEPRPAYDRVHLTEYFAHGCADRLSLGSAAWYAERGIDLRIATRVVRIRRADRVVETDRGSGIAYDVLVLATGSAPVVPPVPGIAKTGVFVYRTIEDLDAIRARCRTARRAAVVGGGLLGLEAARAVLDAGVETHIVELAPRLMSRQLDDAGAALLEAEVRRLGVVVHLNVQIAAIAGDDAALRVELAGGGSLDVDLVIIAVGIRPRDELARAAGIAVGPRGGILVDDVMQTCDPHVFAVGEVALHRGALYGLVAPGYEMPRCSPGI